MLRKLGNIFLICGLLQVVNERMIAESLIEWRG